MYAHYICMYVFCVCFFQIYAGGTDISKLTFVKNFDSSMSTKRNKNFEPGFMQCLLNVCKFMQSTREI